MKLSDVKICFIYFLDSLNQKMINDTVLKVYLVILRDFFLENSFKTILDL